MLRVAAYNLAFSYPVPFHRRGWPFPGAGRARANGDGGQPRGETIPVLEDVSLQLETGRRMAVVGRNGAGKSTLLRLLAGIYPPDQGRVITSGSVEALFTLRGGFRTDASGYENILLRGLLHGLRRREVEELVPEIAEFAELEDRLHMPLKTYSQGMIGRLALATVTALHPDILVLDEWIGAGDRAFRRKARQRIIDFVGRAGVVIIASHNRQILEELCDSAIWLERGRVVAQGDIQDVLTAYDGAC